MEAKQEKLFDGHCRYAVPHGVDYCYAARPLFHSIMRFFLKTIRQIRTVQISYQFLVFIDVLITGVFVGAALNFYELSKYVGGTLTNILVLSLSLSVFLWLIIKRLRCPVCRGVFVGKESPELFTDKCTYCGRRSGDTH